MREFFKQQLENLQARTGIRQLEHLMAKDTWKEDVDQLIKFMIEECSKPPFDVVRQEVKERVITRAIVEDQDFIGLNAKFVRRALNVWWLANGDRVIEAMNAKEAKVYERVELTPEQKAKIDVMASSYIARLLQGDGIKEVPDVGKDVAAKEGAEWKSELERKAVSVKYQPPPDEYFETQERIRKAGSELYKGRLELRLDLFKVDKFSILAESQSDAEKIYAIAAGEK